MNIFDSSMLFEDELESLCKQTVFTVEEIELLYERFKYLDRSNKGTLTFLEFQMIPEFHSNPLSPIIMSYIENNSNYSRIDFVCFLEFLQIFSPKTDRKIRIDFLFKIFDLNKTEKLTRAVLNKLHTMMTGIKNDKETEKVLNMYDKGRKGYISRSDFSKLYESDPSLDQNMIINFQRHNYNTNKVGWRDLIWPSTKE